VIRKQVRLRWEDAGAGLLMSDLAVGYARGQPRVRRDVRQVVVSPVGRHSEKPQEVHHRIEKLYGPQRPIELFARRQVPGWDAVGDGIDGSDIREVLVGA